jgi:hypothetical protein
MRDPK